MRYMNIRWYGKNCVRIEAKEGTILIDPFDTKDTGLRGPTINDDLVLLSAHEQSASVLERINDTALLIRGPGEYEQKGVAVRGIQAYQDSQGGKELGLCTVYVVVAEDIAICHLGGLGQGKLTDEQIEAIGDPDILIIPVGGQSALDPKAAAELVTAIEPKVVIPVGFAVPSASYKAEKPEKFIKELGLPVQRIDIYRIQKKALPADQTALVALEL